MKPLEHYQATAERHGPLTGALAVLPDIGVAMQRLPSAAARRWGAYLHHSGWAEAAAGRLWPRLGTAWEQHMTQDALSHPPGTYGIPETAGLPATAAMVVAYSGGPDSFIAWRLLGHPPAAYLDMGNKAAAAERKLVSAAGAAFGNHGIRVEEAPDLAELESGWIPNRNLALILACYQVRPVVVLARIAEWGPDKNPAFFRRVERLVNSSSGGHFQGAAHQPRLRILTPFGHLTKTRLVRLYLEQFGREAGAAHLIEYTRSCYRGTDRWCGECGACWCRHVAFTANGIDERDRYDRLPTRPDFYRRLDWRDFRPGMVPMYVKRHREMRAFG